MSKPEKTYVIAYDISCNKRRRKVVKEIIRNGGRVNLSVFECTLTPKQKIDLIDALLGIINTKKDRIVIYALCSDCLEHRIFIPEIKHTPVPTVVVV